MLEIISIIILVVVLSIIIDKYHYTRNNIPSHNNTDHHIHVPIDSVPAEYYSAYSDYLKSPEWRAFRKLVLKRDKYRCVDCGVPAYHKDICPTGSRLQVHHIHYDGIESMAFTTDQCVSVCHPCHKARHSR